MLARKIHFYVFILLSATILYSSEKFDIAAGNAFLESIHNRMMIREQQELNSDIQTVSNNIGELLNTQTKQNIYVTMMTINDSIPSKSTRSQIFNGVLQKTPVLQQKINDYIEQFIQDECLFQHGCDNLDQLLKNHIISKTIQNTYTPILLPCTRNRQKVSLKFLSAETIALLHFVSGDYEPDCGIGRWTSPTTWKQLKFFNLKTNEKIISTKEIYYNLFTDLDDKKKYSNQPRYNDTCNWYPGLIPWHNESQLTNRMDSFSNGTFVITYPWGGIELHDNNKQEYFIINNSIASVCCCKNEEDIILGTYDGHIIIINITKENLNKDYTTKNFSDYYKDITAKHPFIIAEKQIDTQLPIMHIACTENIIYFATKNSIYRYNLTSSKNIINSECTIFDDEEITAMSILNELPVYATNKGNIIVQDANNQKISYKAYPENEKINCLYIYNNENKTFILTGTQNGHLDMWIAVSETGELFNKIHIKHDYPVYSIEVSPDKKHILVKTAEIQEEPDIKDLKKTIDHAYIYNTPEGLFENGKQHNLKIYKQEAPTQSLTSTFTTNNYTKNQHILIWKKYVVGSIFLIAVALLGYKCFSK